MHVQSCSFARSNPATEIALRYPFLKNVNYKIPQFKHIHAVTFLIILLTLLMMLFNETNLGSNLPSTNLFQLKHGLKLLINPSNKKHYCNNPNVLSSGLGYGLGHVLGD